MKVNQIIRAEFFFSLIVVLILSILNNRVNAQSADAVKYYIAYDRSGSVANVDAKNNLQEMLKGLLDIVDTSGAILSAADFNIYFFGENSDDTLAHSRGGDNLVRVQELLKKSKQSSKSRFTHIDLALSRIIKSLTDNSKISTGIFILTDGRIDNSDVDYERLQRDSETDHIKSPEQYREYCRQLIRTLQLKTKERVFFIQTSPLQFLYESVLDSVIGGSPRNFLIDSSYAQNNRYFWLSTQQGINDTPAIYQEAYQNFIYKANATIVTTRDLQPESEVDASILTQEVLTLKKEIDSPSLTLLSDSKFKAALNNIESLRILLAAGADPGNKILTKENIQEIKAYIDKLLDNNSIEGLQLLALRDTMVKKIVDAGAKEIPTNEILLTESYNPALATPLTTIHEKRGVEDMEQALILGLTDYVIDRAKQEAVYAFLDNLDGLLEKNNLVDVRNILFPNVSELIGNKNAYPDMNILQAAFQLDVKRFPENIIKLKKKGFSSGLYTLYFFLQLYEQLKYNGSLEIAFSKVHKQVRGEFNSETDKIKADCSVHRSLISLKLTTGLIDYLEENDLAELYNSRDETSLDILSRLLIILTIDSADIDCINIDSAARNVRIVYREYQTVKKQMRALQKLTTHKPAADFEGYRQYQKDILLDILQGISKLLIAGNDIMNYVNIPGCDDGDCKTSPINSEVRNQIRGTSRQMEKAIDAWFLVKNKNYLRAMYNLSPELLKIIDTKDSAKLRQLMFVAGEVASANTAEDVKNVIAKYTLPVGSYKTKRYSKQSIMITAYPGVGGAFYWSDTCGKLAVISPIGIEYTKSIRPCGREKSFSILFSIIDIGNVINYRLLGSTDGSTDSDIVSFNRIFSPGLHLSVGSTDKFPLSIIGGYQYNPSRITFGLTLDMPLLGIWKQD